METSDLTINEKKIFETIVKYDKSKFDTKLCITNKRIILEKKYGIFRKNYKIVDTINIKDIANDRDSVQIDNDEMSIIIKTNDNTYKFICDSLSSSKKIKHEIEKIKDESNVVVKASKNVIKISNGVTNSVVAITGAIGSVGLAVRTVSKHKEEIVDTLISIKNIFTKH